MGQNREEEEKKNRRIGETENRGLLDQPFVMPQYLPEGYSFRADRYESKHTETEMLRQSGASPSHGVRQGAIEARGDHREARKDAYLKEHPYCDFELDNTDQGR